MGWKGGGLMNHLPVMQVVIDFISSNASHCALAFCPFFLPLTRCVQPIHHHSASFSQNAGLSILLSSLVLVFWVQYLPENTEASNLNLQVFSVSYFFLQNQFPQQTLSSNVCIRMFGTEVTFMAFSLKFSSIAAFAKLQALGTLLKVP